MKKSAFLFSLSPKKKILLLFVYHLFFIFFAFQLRVNKGISDSHLYWFKSNYTLHKSWLNFAAYGTDFMLFLNYPFVALGLPFWFGFLLYGLIGFFGILKWVQWSELVVKDSLTYKEFNFLYLLFFLPNVHVWTSTLGKEPLVFWGIASVLYAVTVRKYMTFNAIIGGLLVLLIRPHVALMLFSAIVLVFLFQQGYSLRKRIILAFFSFIGLLVLLFMVFQLSHIRYWDWNRIVYFNEYSILSFRHSGSYVPMLDYNIFYKIFSFHFRPLFFDANSTLSILASFENIFVLSVFIVALYFLVLYYRQIIYKDWIRVVFLFVLVGSLLYVQRYANLGIFMRTKMMFHPFFIIALLEVMRQGLILSKPKF